MKEAEGGGGRGRGREGGREGGSGPEFDTSQALAFGACAVSVWVSGWLFAALRLYVCVCVCVFVQAAVRVCVYACVCMFARATQTQPSVCVCVCVCVCVRASALAERVRTCTGVCACACWAAAAEWTGACPLCGELRGGLWAGRAGRDEGSRGSMSETGGRGGGGHVRVGSPT